MLHLPGHSPGSIALFDESDGTLFSGDVVYDDVLLDELPGSDREEYVHTMNRLREVPVRIVRLELFVRIRYWDTWCVTIQDPYSYLLVLSTREGSNSQRSPPPVRRERTEAGPSRDPSH